MVSEIGKKTYVDFHLVYTRHCACWGRETAGGPSHLHASMGRACQALGTVIVHFIHLP